MCMSHRYLVLCPVFALLLGACTATVDNHYLLLSQDTRKPMQTFEQVVAAPTATRLVAGELTRRELNQESPLLNINGNRSVYELFSFPANLHQEFLLTVDGVTVPGPSPVEVIPLVVVLDEHGTVVPVSNSRRQHDMSLTEAAAMKVTVSGRTLRQGMHYAVVIADNGLAGSAVGRVAGLPVYPSPFGPVRVMLLFPSG